MTLLVVAILAGCSKHTPSCEDAINKAAGKIPQLAEPKAKAEVVSECIKAQWPEATRTCIAGVRDEPDFLACIMRLTQSGATPIDRRALMFGDSKVDIAKITASKLTAEAYPQWVRVHPDKTCPDTLNDLLEYTDVKDAKDPGGMTQDVLRCGLASWRTRRTRNRFEW